MFSRTKFARKKFGIPIAFNCDFFFQMYVIAYLVFISCYIEIGVWGEWKILKSRVLSKLPPRKDQLDHF